MTRAKRPQPIERFRPHVPGRRRGRHEIECWCVHCGELHVHARGAAVLNVSCAPQTGSLFRRLGYTILEVSGLIDDADGWRIARAFWLQYRGWVMSAVGTWSCPVLGFRGLSTDGAFAIQRQVDRVDYSSLSRQLVELHRGDAMVA